MVYLAVQPKAVYMGKRQTMKFSFPISTQYVYVVCVVICEGYMPQLGEEQHIHKPPQMS